MQKNMEKEINGYYNSLYKCKQLFQKDIEKYIIDNELTYDDSYFICKKWLNDMLEKAYKNEDCLNEFSTYFLLKPTTSYLRKILNKHTNYNEDNLIHFNAMCLMDSVKASIPKICG